MFTATTNKKKAIQYILGAILILTVALASSAYRSGPANFEHQDNCQATSTFNCFASDESLQAREAETARWAAGSAASAASALYTFNPYSDLDNEAARWEAATDLYAGQLNVQQRASQTDASRWTAIEALYSGQDSARTADSARWEASAAQYSAQADQQRAQAASAARWTANADFFVKHGVAAK